MRSAKIFNILGAPCVSAGVIFFRFKNGQLEFLLQHKPDKRQKWWYEDLGGKSNPEDKSLDDTAAREVDEESNNQITKAYAKQLMSRDSIALLYQKAKYLVYIVHLPDQKEFDFGDHENHPKYVIKRYIKWVSLADVKKIPFAEIHPRIRHFYRMVKLF